MPVNTPAQYTLRTQISTLTMFIIDTIIFRNMHQPFIWLLLLLDMCLRGSSPVYLLILIAHSNDNILLGFILFSSIYAIYIYIFRPPSCELSILYQLPERSQPLK